ncbi:MAG TPA: glycosyltransferase [Gammaproteobacteria bacterium]
MNVARVSVVVPVFSDTGTLARLLDHIAAWAVRPAEIVAVSAEPDDDLARLCESGGCRYLEAIRCRGAQLDTGARAATGEILWFLHADVAPRPGSLEAIEDAIAGGACGGHFRFLLAGKPAAWKSAISALTNLRTRLGGIPYGDQGLFATRDAYLAAGGFPHQPLFEEVRLVKALRRGGHFRALNLPIDVAPRRWERDGWIYRSLANRMLALRYSMGASADRLATDYRGAKVSEREATS